MTTTIISPALTHARRLLLDWRRNSSAIVNTLGVPIFMTLITRAMFGDLIRAVHPDGELDLLPLTVMMIFAVEFMIAIPAAAEMIREKRLGMAARFATTPAGTGAYVTGTLLFTTARMIAGGILVVAVAIPCGLRIHTVAAGLWLASFIVLAALTAGALSILIGSAFSTPESAMVAAPLVMIMQFFNEGLMPADRFVTAVRPLAVNSPVSHAVRTATGLNDGTGTGDSLVFSLLWFGGLLVVFAWGALRASKRST
ncbi:ABC transporter permease [Corynebacterium pygosceleis]|uniref:ABC transporter permease n=1 Tax=Corynebacterium pygosceleis TaxID=2800406 RepID=A0A9Q4GIQ9_9CORY|nr:ABC transporter permease [Corynebacterium pygosceleis]MCK7637830.1 ABC transporter permease [Corynebacterium pygosceleis]MCK7675544.1 ABC transporter permease [Corynebacterium pygosceleis]MCL0121062.1 ABC transporter permease [Corynebacterium pygosceleis]MCX7444630.1 ABC transporter permease [Corynebacterium pygosceleis]MCX7468546.1 ABC transporter permease [Corynebacterium pygosceleis]